MQRSGRSRGILIHRRVGVVRALLLVGLVAGCGSASSSNTAAPTGSAHAPTFGQTVRLRPVSGKVEVAVSGSAFVPLTTTRVVPVGTRVDTTAGNVELTSAIPPSAKLQTGQFHAGIFEVRQSPSAGGLVDLVIRDTVSRSTGCPAASPAASQPSQRQLGILRGNATGRFRTVGKFGSATVRGTDWGVRDRCDGTLVIVRSGTVDVRDYRLHKDILVDAGQTYLARAA